MLNLKNTLDGYLKNVEVIGNTIQDANNLADIRSVGDKVEGQELYKIELACYGDNILRPDFELGLWNVSNGTAQADSTAIRTKGFLRIRNQVHLVKRFDGKLGCQVILFDENFKYLGQQSYAGGNYVRYDNILPNAKYMKINFLNTTDLNLQCVLFDRVPSNINGVEFVEFQESELEILSPVQLEKVGNVVDRIVCKDGVWGVDKKVDAEVKDNVLVNTRTNSEFIPLPHDQQVKLRTFAGQTNIAFLTEIPGQIKAQVPKSLGATVNTHTEQIADLHNSLERVKKLEETTVSTIETERNFTTVDATSNGYFEDVKLEGKTLVNLVKGGNIETDIGVSGTTLSKYDYLTPLKNNTIYTVIFNVDAPNEDLTTLTVSLNGGQLGYTGEYSNGINCITLTTNETVHNRFWVYFNVGSTIVGTPKLSNVIVLEGDHTNNPPEFFESLMSVGQDVEEVSVKSVNENLFSKFTQQNVNSSLNYYDNDTNTYVSSTRTSVDSFYSCIEVNGRSMCMAFDGEGEVDVYYKYTNNKPSNFEEAYLNTRVVTKNTVMSNSNCHKYLVVSFRTRVIGSVAKIRNISIIGNTAVNRYIPHQSNKKPLLYYNPTTETWEKPVLREWDTIEKHSDGKYYYHKRSGEVVLNGSESWTQSWQNESTNTCTFEGFVPQPLLKNNQHATSTFLPLMMCDKIKPTPFGNMWQSGSVKDREDSITTYIGNKLVTVISKSKLSTQDVEGFKAWLKANPTTVVYQLEQEEVYECTNIDLMTYSGETNYIINSGAISPKSLLKVHNNISNVVKILQEKVSLLENTFIAGLKSVLSGDMYSLATILYPEDFEQNDNTEQDIMVIPE